MRGLVWFRRDLRIHDQPALSNALLECREVTGLFIFDVPLLQSNTFGAPLVSFMLECIENLRDALQKRHIPFHWYQGIPTEEIVKAALDAQADRVYWGRDYEPTTLERDRVARLELEKHHIEVRTFKNHTIFEPDEILGSSGDPLQRFGAYKARWWKKWDEAGPHLRAPSLKANSISPFKPVNGSPLPSLSDLGFSTKPISIHGGEKEGLKRLKWYVQNCLQTYSTGRNHPFEDNTSILSPHFRFGTVSARYAAQAALATLTKGRQVSRKDVLTWVDELIWRDFFQQILFHHPRVATESFRAQSSRPNGRFKKTWFEAWCSGNTGFPLVDAGMRQLNRTGWMHNRVRMVVASFLVKDLRFDWRLGERYFMEHLLDADLAANNGNWQWCASTGTDAMPGYRIFNPTLQAKKFDPDGDYIRRFVPELKQVPTKLIHQPELMSVHEQDQYLCHLGHDYPYPIVDHHMARQAYLGKSGK